VKRLAPRRLGFGAGLLLPDLQPASGRSFVNDAAESLTRRLRTTRL
jgi:hypothetical protein